MLSLHRADFDFCNILLGEEKLDLLMRGKEDNNHGENVLHALVRTFDTDNKQTIQLFYKMTEKVSILFYLLYRVVQRKNLPMFGAVL